MAGRKEPKLQLLVNDHVEPMRVTAFGVPWLDYMRPKWVRSVNDEQWVPRGPLQKWDFEHRSYWDATAGEVWVPPDRRADDGGG